MRFVRRFPSRTLSWPHLPSLRKFQLGSPQEAICTQPAEMRETGGGMPETVWRKFNRRPTDLAFVTLAPSCLPQPKQLSFAYDLWTMWRKLRKMQEGVGSFG